MTNTATSFFPEGYPEPLEVIGNIAFEKLREKGFDVKDAQAAAFDIAERARAELGGGSIYIPRGARFDAKTRNKVICQEFNGTNFAALARKYRISEMRVRMIINEEREITRTFNK